MALLNRWCRGRVSRTRVPALVAKFGSQPGLGVVSCQFKQTFEF